MNKIPTAEEFTMQTPILVDMWNDTRGQGEWKQKEINQVLIEFAKLHVKAALEAAGNIADQWENSGELKPEILNTYPDNLIQ